MPLPCLPNWWPPRSHLLNHLHAFLLGSRMPTYLTLVAVQQYLMRTVPRVKRFVTRTLHRLAQGRLTQMEARLLAPVLLLLT